MIVLHKEDFINLRNKLFEYSSRAPQFQFNYIMKLDMKLEDAINNFVVNDKKLIEIYNEIDRFLGGK